MPHVSNVISWVIFFALLNYVAWSMTGLTPVWGLACQIGKELQFYVALVNLGLAVGMVIGGIWYGVWAVIQVGAVLVGFNLIPSITKAVFAFGKTCGV
jgi:hypothetical protein